MELEELHSADAVIQILEQDHDPRREGLGAAVKRAIESAESWPDNYLLMSRIWVADDFYADDSKKKPGQESPDHLKGDLKKAAHEQVHWWVGARFKPLKLAFQAHWQEGVTPKGARSFAFKGASAIDPFGIPTELFVDYSLGANAQKQLKDEPEWAHQERVHRLNRESDERDRLYNTGQSYYKHVLLFSGSGASGRFEQWLEEANGMVAAATGRKEAA